MKQQPALAATLTGLAILSILAAAANAQTAPHLQHHPADGKAAMFETPASIAAEHRQLHETLERAAKEGGALGTAAQGLEDALAPHFRREEEIATPPLTLLPALAATGADRR